MADKSKCHRVSRFLSIADVCDLTTFSRTTIFHRVNDNPTFPKPVSLSDDGIRKAFVAEEVFDWMQSRIAARDANDTAKGGAA